MFLKLSFLTLVTVVAQKKEGCRVPQLKQGWKGGIKDGSYYEDFGNTLTPLPGWKKPATDPTPGEILDWILEPGTGYKGGTTLSLEPLDAEPQWGYISQTNAAILDMPYKLFPGSTIGMVAKPVANGQLYLAFQSDDINSASFVLNTMSNLMQFELNAPTYGDFQRLNSVPFQALTDTFYRVEVQIVDTTSVIGRICDIKTNELVANPIFQSYAGIDFNKGIGLRGFGDGSPLVDTLYVLYPGDIGPIPVPGTPDNAPSAGIAEIAVADIEVAVDETIDPAVVPAPL
jgi:hypothetical protein